MPTIQNKNQIITLISSLLSGHIQFTESTIGSQFLNVAHFPISTPLLISPLLAIPIQQSITFVSHYVVFQPRLFYAAFRVLHEFKDSYYTGMAS